MSEHEPEPEHTPAIADVRSAFAERVRAWTRALPEAVEIDAAELRMLAAQFVISAAEIHDCVEAVVTGAASAAAAADSPELAEALWDHCRARARPRMAEVAKPVEVRARLGDLVLPEHHTRMLESIALVLRHRVKVLHDWGFAELGAPPGVSAVFAGPSGTGKTMAAEALANAVRLDLYRVELGAVLGARVSETEARLRQLFDAAQTCGAVLLFDDADALFGAGEATRRTELELGYLIQRMNSHPGAILFTTSPRESFDSELLRRARFVIDFPHPPMELREKLWRRLVPAAVPTAGLVFHKLSRLEISGGTIAQIVLAAAYMAAEADSPITMRILLDAARLEYEKRGDELPEDAIRGWL